MSYRERFFWGALAGSGIVLELDFITARDWVWAIMMLVSLPLPFVMGLTRPPPGLH